ncbi:exosome nuclease subunit [Ophidiomyces ophidiicola]|nr:exosome nuclease subunit [Ophidiomyces ophidiicola]
MDISAEYSPFQEKLTAALVQATKTTSQLLADDITFQRSINRDLSDSLDEQSSRFLTLTNTILRFATSSSDLNAPTLEDEENVDENWRSVVDVIDELLEKADACLDEFTGVIKKLSPSQEERAQQLSSRSTRGQFPSVYDFTSSKFPKPQLLFKHRPDNHDTSPFRPILRYKPHALVPLPPAVDSPERYQHPYAKEIKDCQYPPFVYSKSEPEMYLPFESTTATFVNTLEGVKAMLAELKGVKEIAIDLEHHDRHSYHGIVCLMQISTREKDWIVDTLLPWREELNILNEVFADPQIVKVLHGSTMDVIWLQRDLGLYLVGLFDTYHASAALHFPKKSLKFLLEKYVNFQAEKKYQMADWRLRPLLPGMFDYARSDTHYLLYIYDRLRHDLLENSTPEDDLIDYVLERSKSEALQRYEKPVYDSETGQGAGGWYDALQRNSGLFNREQLAVFKAVHQWRDRTARTEDEGVQFVLSKRALFAVAHAMPLDQTQLLIFANPASPPLKKRLSELLNVIKQAKITGADGPELHEVLGAKTGTEAGYVRKTDAATPTSKISEDQAKPIRVFVSQFWGSTLPKAASVDASSYAMLAASDGLELSLPLPSVPIHVSEAPRPAAPQDATPPASTVMPVHPKPAEDDGAIFTVKQFGAPPKRKATVPSDEAPLSPRVSSSGAGSPRPDAQAAASKKKQKPNRETAQNAVPFDYASAESVLQARDAPPAATRRAPFNPYAKSLNGPQAPRKSKKDMGGGKSFTFRQ